MAGSGLGGGRGWVLVGGRSSRFGTDKARYEVDGMALAVRVARVLTAAGLDVGVIGKAPMGLGLPEVLELEPGHHPLFGVAAGLDHGDGFFAPCDLVDLTVEQVRAVLARAPARAGGQPLLGAFPGADADRARAMAFHGEAVGAFVAPFAVVDIGAITNLNHRPGSRGEGGGAP